MNIYREIQHVGQGGSLENWNDSQVIDWLEVATPCQPGFLEMRVCLKWNQDGEKKTYTRELTYSGTYTVWWEEEATE